MIDQPGLEIEISHWNENRKWIAGVDEAGRGALAGPIIAAAVILPSDPEISKKLDLVYDSKILTAAQRERSAIQIKQYAVNWSIGMVAAEVIDEIGIQPANQRAMSLAIDGLFPRPDFNLLDFIHWKNCPYAHQRYKKGETVSLSIAAASIIAKTHRDEIMMEYAKQYQKYGLAKNKGYGTQFHREAIKQFGFCEIHRKTFTLK